MRCDGKSLYHWSCPGKLLGATPLCFSLGLESRYLERDVFSVGSSAAVITSLLLDEGLIVLGCFESLWEFSADSQHSIGFRNASYFAVYLSAFYWFVWVKLFYYVSFNCYELLISFYCFLLAFAL